MTFLEWLIKLSETERPDKSIVAYNFGIFETAEGYTVYLTGSKEFDEDDSDWATNEDFVPQLKYFPLPSEFKELEWDQLLERVVEMLKDFLKSEVYLKSFFANAKAIATGFDDGDLVQLK